MRWIMFSSYSRDNWPFMWVNAVRELYLYTGAMGCFQAAYFDPTTDLSVIKAINGFTEVV